MHIQQVFTAYDIKAKDNSNDVYRFCPTCATPLSTQQRGGRPRPACDKCGFVYYRNPLPGVVTVVPRDGKLLLGRRSGSYGRGKWGLPQGFIEYDEDFVAAAVREVREETGLEVRITALLNVVTNYLTPDLHSLAVILLAQIISGQARAGDDLQQLMWLAPGDNLPPMAFEADIMTVTRYWETAGSEGIPLAAR